MKRATFFKRILLLSGLVILGLLSTALLGNVPLVRADDEIDLEPIDIAGLGRRFWKLNGNFGSDPTINFLGTRDEQPLVFKTDGEEAARIDTDGNVGIGTTDPGAQLEILSSAKRAKQVILRAFLNQTVNILEVYNAGQRPTIFFDRFGKAFFGNGLRVWANIDAFDRPGGISDHPVLQTTTGPGPEANVLVRPRFPGFLPFAVRGLASQTENLQEWQDDNANALSVVDAIGRIGIGTSDPNSKLEISDGYLELDTSDGTPPTSDCDSLDEVGRMKVDSSNPNLYVCVVNGGTPGWITK